jgi:tRNA threonylcarbamoyladenosine biosynthesis protein TsaE
MIRLATNSVESTGALAAALSTVTVGGDVIVLAGELGAGKTAFVKSFASALGVEETVTSPTFTLVREYRGRVPVFHLDVYRLGRLSEVDDLDLGAMVESGGVTLIEWGDGITAALGNDYLELRLQYGVGDDDRTVHLSLFGQRWLARRRALTEALNDWLEDPPC